MKLNGRVHILVEKRTYKPAGWKKLRDMDVACRVTAKRIYVPSPGKIPPQVFSRDTGVEIVDGDTRRNQSIRYTAQSMLIHA